MNEGTVADALCEAPRGTLAGDWQVESIPAPPTGRRLQRASDSRIQSATNNQQPALFGVGAMDLLTYGAVILLLAIAAVIAALVPARRAMKIDPVIALRYE